MQPQRGFGQLYRHGVFVYAEDGFLQDHAAHNVAVVQLRVGDRPTVGGGGGFNAAANIGNARHQRAKPGLVFFYQVRRPGLGVDLVSGGVDGL